MNLPLPELPEFTYERPTTLAGTTSLLKEHAGEAKVFMGGTDLLVQMRGGHRHPKLLIDIKQLPGLLDIAFEMDDGLKIGAAVTMNDIAKFEAVTEHYPLLVEAIETVASYQIRNRATMGGNLANASPAADTAPAAMVLGASLCIHGPKGERRVPIDAFFTGPGQSVLETDEFLTKIEFPPPITGAVGRYRKLGRNAEGDLAIAGVAALGYPSGTTASGYEFRVALASVAPTPIRVPVTEKLLASEPITEEILQRAAQAAEDAASPIDDVRASARYRKAMVRELTQHALSDIWTTLQKEV